MVTSCFLLILRHLFADGPVLGYVCPCLLSLIATTLPLSLVWIRWAELSRTKFLKQPMLSFDTPIFIFQFSGGAVIELTTVELEVASNVNWIYLLPQDIYCIYLLHKEISQSLIYRFQLLQSDLIKKAFRTNVSCVTIPPPPLSPLNTKKDFFKTVPFFSSTAD